MSLTLWLLPFSVFLLSSFWSGHQLYFYHLNSFIALFSFLFYLCFSISVRRSQSSQRSQAIFTWPDQGFACLLVPVSPHILGFPSPVNGELSLSSEAVSILHSYLIWWFHSKWHQLEGCSETHWHWSLSLSLWISNQVNCLQLSSVH